MLPLRSARTSPRALTRLRCFRFRFALLVLPTQSHPRSQLQTPVPSPFSARFCSTHSKETANPDIEHPAESEQTAPDHRSLGVQQQLFTTSIYSPGSPIFLPNGTRIFNRLVEFLRKQYVHYGFEEVLTPTIYKKSLWAKSGHLENYAEDMFTVTSTSPSRADVSEDGSKEEEEYGLKPMNCPGHCLIYAAQRRSYRDLPIRYADFSPLHRNEVSGALSGLTRVRRFHQDDGHIFCRPSQIEEEIRQTLSFVRETYKTLKLGPYRLVLSTRPEDHYIGELAEWDQAENALRQALDTLGEPWSQNLGDGAFYGPKIDIILRDSDGKEHQTATIQLDFQLPKRFELEYHAPAPEAERKGEPTTTTMPMTTEIPGGDPAVSGPVRPVLIHRAILGSAERLMALLIEHYNGRWPFWLNPRQVMIITVNDTQAVVDKARAVRKQLLMGGGRGGGQQPNGEGTQSVHHAAIHATSAASQLSIDVDDSARSLPLKLREAKSKRYGVIITVGPKEVSSDVLAVNISGMPDVTLPDGEAVMFSKKLLRMEPAALYRLLKHTVDSYK